MSGVWEKLEIYAGDIVASKYNQAYNRPRQAYRIPFPPNSDRMEMRFTSLAVMLSRLKLADRFARVTAGVPARGLLTC